MSDAHSTDPAKPSYEAARDELADVVRQLEQGGATLEQSLELWERGEQLARTCQSWLDGAKARLDAALSNDSQADDGQASDGMTAGGRSADGQAARQQA